MKNERSYIRFIENLYKLKAKQITYIHIALLHLPNRKKHHHDANIF